MELTGLSHITNVPENPIDLFISWRNDAQTYSPDNPYNDVMTVADVHNEDEVLNRNVVLRKYDQNGFAFETERISMKFKDFKKNQHVAAVLLWIYMINDTTVVTRQVRITGKICELNDAEIAKFYKKASLQDKIRSQISPMGAKINWCALKAKFDQVLNAYIAGKHVLKQTKSYTVLRIVPRMYDFYYGVGNEIADRVKYTIKHGKWINYHIGP